MKRANEGAPPRMCGHRLAGKPLDSPHEELVPRQWIKKQRGPPLLRPTPLSGRATTQRSPNHSRAYDHGSGRAVACAGGALVEVLRNL